jgi:hypothetical protein
MAVGRGARRGPDGCQTGWPDGGGQTEGQTGPDGVLEGWPDGVARRGARRGQKECMTGPDGVPNGAGRGARRGLDGVPNGAGQGARQGQTDAMSSATSFLNAMSPV